MANSYDISVAPEVAAVEAKVDAVIATLAAFEYPLMPNISLGQYGGDGSDGDVTISADTTISAAIRNYLNLTVDSTKILSPAGAGNSGILIIGIKETLTLNGIISVDETGNPGGIGGWLAANPGTGGINGQQNGTISAVELLTCISGAGGGGGGSTPGRLDDTPGKDGGGAGGTGGTGSADAIGTIGVTTSIPKVSLHRVGFKPDNINILGAGGGGGSGQSNQHGGDGGLGGGLIYIECDTLVFNAGAKFTANGMNGYNGDSNGTLGGGGGGGGGGGFIWIRAKNITTNAGTFEVTGGTGGTGGAGTTSAGLAGGVAANGQCFLDDVKL